MCVRDPAFLGTLADRLQLFYRDTSRSTVKFKEASSIVTPGRRDWSVLPMNTGSTSGICPETRRPPVWWWYDAAASG